MVIIPKKTQLMWLFGENLPDSQENTVILDPVLCAHFELVMGTRCWLQAQKGAIKRNFGVEVNVPRKWSLNRVGCSWEGLLVQAKKLSQPILGIEFPWANNEKSSYDVKGHSFSFFLVGGLLFSSVESDCALFTFHLDSGQSTCHASLLFYGRNWSLIMDRSLVHFLTRAAESAAVFFLFGLGSRNLQSRR
jgi:hypothetical protein